MIIKVLWVIVWCIIIFALGFYTGHSKMCCKVYNAMIEALNSVSVEKNGADYVRGVIYACEKVDEIIVKENKEDEED